MAQFKINQSKQCLLLHENGLDLHQDLWVRQHLQDVKRQTRLSFTIIFINYYHSRKEG